MDRKVTTEKPLGEESWALWRARITSALDFRAKHWNGDARWKQNERLVKFDHWSEGGVGDSNATPAQSDVPRDRITVNLALSLVQDFVAFLLNHAPRFLAKPRKQEKVDQARRQSSLLNYFWREQGMQRQIKRAVWDGVTIGHGIVKTGYTLEIDRATSETPDVDGELEYDTVIKADAPFIRRIPPYRFIIDPDARDQDLATARWVAEVFFVPLQDVVANSRYSSELRNKIAAGVVVPKTRRSYLEERARAEGQILDFVSEDESAAQAMCVGYEVWDKKFRTRRVFLEGVDEPLLEEEWPYPYLDGFPYEKWDFIPIPDEMYGVGLPLVIEDQQLELNRVRTAQFIHRRNFGKRMYQVLKNGIDPAEVTKLTVGEDGTIVTVNVPGALEALESPALPQDSERVEAAIKEDIRQLTGSDKMLEGAALTSRTSATEIRTRAQVMNMKTEDRIAEVDDFVHRVVRQILQHLRANLRSSVAVRIDGADGTTWETARPEDVQAETDVEVVSTVAERVDPMMDRQQAMALFQNTLQNLPMLSQVGVKVNVAEMFRWMMEKFDDKDVMRFISPTPLPPLMAQGAGGPDAAAGAVGPDPRMAGIMAASAGPESAAAGGLTGAMLGGGAG